jgi:hypothetical protein
MVVAIVGNARDQVADSLCVGDFRLALLRVDELSQHQDDGFDVAVSRQPLHGDLDSNAHPIEPLQPSFAPPYRLLPYQVPRQGRASSGRTAVVIVRTATTQ